ncbi:MAG: hypothetical protein M1826_001787 [Phylliscum demangeonii]|nr:MAG: hypothetical protein M1826_001787 [Phylliscum demangeonii]
MAGQQTLVGSAMASTNQDDNDSSDQEFAAPAKPFPTAGQKSIEAMFAGRERDRMTSKKLVRELADTAGAPSTVFHRSLCIGRFLRFWEVIQDDIGLCDWKIRTVHGCMWSCGGLSSLAASMIDSEVTRWLKESGFHIYLAGVDKAALLLRTAAPMRPPPGANQWIRSLYTLYKAAMHAMTELNEWADPNRPDTRISRRQRCLLRSFRADETSLVPFQVVAKEDTIRRYADEWARALCFVVRHAHVVWQEDLAVASPRVSVSAEQQQCVDEAVRVAMSYGAQQPEMREAVHALSLA